MKQAWNALALFWEEEVASVQDLGNRKGGRVGAWAGCMGEVTRGFDGPAASMVYRQGCALPAGGLAGE